MLWVGRNLKANLIPSRGQVYLLLDHLAPSPIQPGLATLPEMGQPQLLSATYAPKPASKPSL